MSSTEYGSTSSISTFGDVPAQLETPPVLSQVGAGSGETAVTAGRPHDGNRDGYPCR